MDRLALSVPRNEIDKKLLTPIKVREGFVNLSGIETQCQRIIKEYGREVLSASLMDALSRSILEMTVFLCRKYEINDFIYAGGVSCSLFLRQYLTENLPQNINIAFGRQELSSDNAVGISLLGGKKIWR